MEAVVPKTNKIFLPTNTLILNQYRHVNFLQTGYIDCQFNYLASPDINSMKTNASHVELVWIPLG